MVWVVGILGLIAGFIAGQLYLLKALKDKSKHELLHDRNLHWSYGLLNWAIAVVTCVCSVLLYRQFF
jgi:hypothetical protein